jgi:hypothetical protein
MIDKTKIKWYSGGVMVNPVTRCDSRKHIGIFSPPINGLGMGAKAHRFSFVYLLSTIPGPFLFVTEQKQAQQKHKGAYHD